MIGENRRLGKNTRVLKKGIIWSKRNDSGQSNRLGRDCKGSWCTQSSNFRNSQQVDIRILQYPSRLLS